MAKINDTTEYPTKPIPVDGDYVIGSDSETALKETKNFLLSSLGAALTGMTTVTNAIQTTDATVTDIVEIPLAEGKVISVDVDVIGRKSDGTDRAGYRITGTLYRNTSGNVILEGQTSYGSHESSAAWDVDIAADTTEQAVDVRVTGVAATTINWDAVVRYRIV